MNDEENKKQPTKEQIENAQNDPKKKVIENEDGSIKILDKMYG